jgi:hypothetical protein
MHFQNSQCLCLRLTVLQSFNLLIFLPVMVSLLTGTMIV